jgi:hypothetical protein
MNMDIKETARYHLGALNILATEFDQEQYERIADKLLDLYKLFGAMPEVKNDNQRP